MIMMFAAFLSLALPWVVASGLETEYHGCTFTFKDRRNVTATYNLSLFHLVNDAFTVNDDDVDDHKYHFNICGHIPESYWYDNDTIPSYCRSEQGTSDPCIDISPNGTCLKTYEVTEYNPASAIQINENSKKCNWLGAELHNLSVSRDFSVSLYDNHDVAAGIIYTIENGAWCESASINRALQIEFTCPDSPREYFDPLEETSADQFNESVIEYPTCIYTITYETSLACPQECIVMTEDTDDKDNDGNLVEFSVCNGRGICDHDPNLKRVRCLCDDGWTGDYCTEQSTSDSNTIYKKTSNSGMLTALIICIILLVLAAVGVIYLNYRARRIQSELASTNAARMLAQEDDITRASDEYLENDVQNDISEITATTANNGLAKRLSNKVAQAKNKVTKKKDNESGLYATLAGDADADAADAAATASGANAE